jgi:hypothetical protein
VWVAFRDIEITYAPVYRVRRLSFSEIILRENEPFQELRVGAFVDARPNYQVWMDQHALPKWHTLCHFLFCPPKSGIFSFGQIEKSGNPGGFTVYLCLFIRFILLSLLIIMNSFVRIPI